MATVLTSIKRIAVFVVSAMKHFIDIFNNGITNGKAAVDKRLKMVRKDLLQNSHA